MSAERFFDDLARTLAEPMPRRRAVRVIGTSLAAIAIPGVRARMAHAGTRSASEGMCGPNTSVCWKSLYPKPNEPYCCGPPGPRFGCGDADNGYQCRDKCPAVNPVSGQRQFFCTSIEKHPSGNYEGWPKNSNCCPRPESNGCSDNGDCLLDCERFFGRGAQRCGTSCCPRGQACRNGRCVACPPGEEACGPTDGGPSKCCCSGGRARCASKCCPKGSRCADPRTGRCETCAKGTEECGSKCCKQGSYCCNSHKGICCSNKKGSCCGESSPICCEDRDCCQISLSRLPICCPQGETCGAAGNFAGLITGRQVDICCIADRVVRLKGSTICCPHGYRSLGGKLVKPPGGGGGLCCKASLMCGSGSSITCCGPQQTCQAGRCV